MNNKENLEKLYNTFTAKSDLLDFFRGLNDYIEFILSVPAWKKVFDEQIAEKDACYKKLDAVEKQSVAEMVDAGGRLLSIILENSVDVKKFKRFQTMEVHHSKNLIEEFSDLVAGDLLIGKYRSNAMNNYLCDIAANLLELGYEIPLTRFMLRPLEYEAYYARINNDAGGRYRTIGNKHGNFVFSKTWPNRWEQELLVEREKIFKRWSAFNELLKFKRAYDLVTKHTNLWPNVDENVNKDFDYQFSETQDFADIDGMVRTLQLLSQQRMRLIKEGGYDNRSRTYAESQDLIEAARIVFTQLTQTKTDDSETGTSRKEIYVSSGEPITSEKTVVNSKIKKGGMIKCIEILKGDGRMKVYVNKEYRQELDFSRGGNWGKLYEVAENGAVKFNKGFLDYFNSNQKNPLYAKHGFLKTKLLKEQDGEIVPNVEIALITKQKLNKRLNSA